MENCNSNRRHFLAATLLAALPTMGSARTGPAPTDDKPITVLHLTDIHIRPEHDAPARCVRILRQIRQNFPNIDLIINTGDTIYAADYRNISRDRVEEQWKIWDEHVIPELKGLPMIHTVGNHDPWWAGPKDDPMVGVQYVCRRLGIEKPYGTHSFGGWEIITLENSGGALDAEQQKWLFDKLAITPETKPLLVAGHLPLYSLSGDYDGGNMKGAKAVIDKLRARKAPVVLLSGHIHLQSAESIWNLRFYCNGALSGSWWEPGQQGDGSYKQTPPGFAVLQLWPDGRSECRYVPVPLG